MTTKTSDTTRRIHERKPVRRTELLTEEEKAATRAIAAEFDRLTALVVEERSRAIPECSMAARVLAEFQRLPRQGRDRFTKAMTRSAGKGHDSNSRRAPYKPGVDGDPFEISPAAIAQLRQLARRRLEAKRSEIIASVDRMLGSQAGGIELRRVAQTVVDLRLAGEANTRPWHREINISSPELLDFKWSTKEVGAGRGYWQLLGPAFLGNPGPVIAAGHLPDNAGEAGIGGYFSIALRDYLPPTAPQYAATYRVRVLPVAPAGQYGIFNGTVGFTNITELQNLAPLPPAGIGPWSQPAIIRYGRVFETPMTEFNIEPLTVYTRIRFSLDYFRLVEDQPGPGAEEFHISGFVVQNTPQGNSVVKFGTSGFNVDPDDRNNHSITKWATFNMPPSTNMPYWPRLYTAIISLMETDDGGEYSEWLASLTRLMDEMVAGAVAADVNAFMNDLREEIEEKQAQLLAEATAEMIALMATMIAATAREAISAFIGAAIAGIVAAIRAGAPDDFYGTQAFGIALWTNDEDRVKDGSAGDMFNSRVVSSGGDFQGTEQADGTYALEMTELQFLGMGHALEGSPTSGIVNMGMHWEFRNKMEM